MAANLILQRCSLTVSRDGGSLITAAHLDLLNNDPMHKNGSSHVCVFYIHTQAPKSPYSTSRKRKKKKTSESSFRVSFPPNSAWFLYLF